MAPSRKQQVLSRSLAESVMAPERGAVKKSISITQRQKQALIDNLQLEITERARRLRAQYALQAQSLRSKLERRVSRVPQALRNALLGELLLKYTAEEEATKRNDSVQIVKKTAVRKDQTGARQQVNPAAAPKSRGIKRKSDELHDQDKENTPDPGHVPTPKRQVRDVENRANPTMVLSPKSNNSRTLPQSPIRDPFCSPAKILSRPNSPLKMASSPFKSAAAAATAGLANMISGKSTNSPVTLSRTNSKIMRAPARPPKVAQSRNVSGTSNASGTSSTSTGTIVRKVGAAIKSSVAPKRAAAANSRTTTAKKTVATRTKAETAAPEVTVANKRVLRKRA